MTAPDVDTLETVFGQATGLWEMPATKFSRKGDSLYDEVDDYIQINLDDWKKYGQFIWLHEAFHSYQFKVEGWPDTDKQLRANANDMSYYCIPTERAANDFARRLCLENGWTVPDYFPKYYWID